MSEVAVREVASTELDRVARLGMWLAAAESNSTDPKARGMAAALRIEYAMSLGLPAHAAQEIFLVKGNLTLSAKLCRALAHSHGLRVVRVSETADKCVAAVIDSTGAELGRTEYTLAMAKKAGLSGSNWTNNPDRMLWARASKRALDDHAPWVTVGVVSAEEVEDVTGEPLAIADAEVVDDVAAIPFGDPE